MVHWYYIVFIVQVCVAICVEVYVDICCQRLSIDVCGHGVSNIAANCPGFITLSRKATVMSWKPDS